MGERLRIFFLFYWYLICIPIIWVRVDLDESVANYFGGKYLDIEMGI